MGSASESIQEKTPEWEFGNLKFTGDDLQWEVKCDRVAISRQGQLLMASFVAETQVVKGIRAVMNTAKKATIQISNVDMKRTRDKCDHYDPQKSYANVGRMGDEYEVRSFKLSYGLAHCVIWTEAPGFIRNLSPQSIWQELKSDNYTTPLLPHWLPYIEAQLRKIGYLEDAWNWRSKCGILSLTTGQLDTIVTEGLSRGEIHVKAPLALEHQGVA